MLYEEIDIINIIDLEKVFFSPKEFTLFKKLNLNIKDAVDRNQFISILGMSGCGKSMLIKILAGLEPYTGGIIKIKGVDRKDCDYLPMVMQQYSSLPWMSVFDNIALPLRMKGVPKQTIEKTVSELISTVGLQGMEDKYATQALLSGGQLQRVAIARTLATNSPIILLDEVTSALDISMKQQIQDLLLNIYYTSKEDRTFINVTHDIREAVLLSDRVIVLAPNPARIIGDIQIDLQGDRRREEVKKSPEFLRYTDQIEALIRSSK